jgi:hypothetical protein
VIVPAWDSSSRFSLGNDGSREVLGEDGEASSAEGWCEGPEGRRSSVLVVLPAGEHPSRRSLDRLAHEFSLKEELDRAWAVRPLELVRERGRTNLVLEDPGGEPLDRILGAPMEMGNFLSLDRCRFEKCRGFCCRLAWMPPT